MAENKKNAPVQELFGKFGEFDSVEELNMAAAGQKEEGDIEALKELAKENGLDPMDAEDYADGMMEVLATPLTAALGRLSVEKELSIMKKPSEVKGPCLIILEFVQSMISDGELAKAVMKKGKRITELDKIMYDSRCHSGTDRDLMEIIKAYYLVGVEEEKKVIKKITERYQ